jgi:threonine/homoserine/homoserine lactone efflux protein
MVNRVKRNYFVWAVLSPVLVGLGHWFVSTAVVTVGCQPLFVDTDFFGVSVMFFLLAVLTFTALVLIVFAGLHALRALRARVQRRQRDRVERLVGTALIGLLCVAVLAISAWLGLGFLFSPCS